MKEWKNERMKEGRYKQEKGEQKKKNKDNKPCNFFKQKCWSIHIDNGFVNLFEDFPNKSVFSDCLIYTWKFLQIIFYWNVKK